MRLAPVDILANWYADETIPWSAQKAVNCLAETAEVGGTRSVAKVKGLPGHLELVDLLTGAPIRGAEDVEGKLFVVSGTSLFEIHNDFSFTNRGNIPGVSLVSMAHNKQGGTTAANELVIANGLSGYVYNTDTTALVQITDEAFPGATTVDYVDGYISFTDPEGRFWGHSALNQATQYSSIDRYDAESAPDKIVSHIVSHREVMVFGTRTTEFFRNTGAATGTFQRVDGTEMEVGIASALSRARLDNTVYWLGSDGLVYRLAGHSPQRVSTRPIEQAISRFNLDNAFAHTWEDRGHQVFYLTFPDGLTFGYDVATGLWHARETYGLDRWGINTTTYWNRLWVSGDYSNGKLYTMDWDTYQDAGQPLVMECMPGVTSADQNKVLCPYVELVMDTGSNWSQGLISLSGDLPDGQVGVAITPYQYQVSGSLPPFLLTVSAGFPPGLSMSSAGLVTGTPTTGGSYSWVVTAADSQGNTVTLNDSAEISVVAYWMTGTDTVPPANSLWVSQSLTNWTGAVHAHRTPLFAPPGSGIGGGGYFQIGESTAILNSNSPSDQIERTTDLNGADDISPTIIPLNVTSAPSRIVIIDGIAIWTDVGGAAFYYTSEDEGATWQQRTVPDGLRVASISRVRSNGRWVAHFGLASTQRHYYSDDDGAPVNWVNGSAAGGSPGPKLIACDSAVVYSTSANQVFRTVDGITWAIVATIPPGSASWNCGDSNGDFIVAGDINNAVITRSVDGGLNWATTPAFNTNLITYDQNSGRFIVMRHGNAQVFTSADNGASIQEIVYGSIVPGGASKTFNIAPIRYVP